MKSTALFTMILVVCTLGAQKGPIWTQVIRRTNMTAATIKFSAKDSSYTYYYAIEGEGVFSYDGTTEKALGHIGNNAEALKSGVKELLFVPGRDNSYGTLVAMTDDPPTIYQLPLAATTPRWSYAAPASQPVIVYDRKYKLVCYINNINQIDWLRIGYNNAVDTSRYFEDEKNLFTIGQDDIYNDDIQFWKVIRPDDNIPSADGFFKTEPDNSGLLMPNKMLLFKSSPSRYHFTHRTSKSHGVLEGFCGDRESYFWQEGVLGDKLFGINITDSAIITDIKQICRKISADTEGWNREPLFLAVATSMGSFLIPQTAITALDYSLTLNELTESELVAYDPTPSTTYVKQLFDDNKRRLFFVNEQGLLCISSTAEVKMGESTPLYDKQHKDMQLHNGRVFLTVPEETKSRISLHTIQGKKLHNQTYTTGGRISFQIPKSISNGMYILLTQYDNKTISHKIRVQQ